MGTTREKWRRSDNSDVRDSPAHRHHHSVDTPHASNTPSSSSVSSIVGLRLYVTSTCPLCDGMHDKIRNLLNAEQYLDGSPAREWFIDVINIDTDDTMSAMRSRVPLLAMVDTDGNEMIMSKITPRLSASRIRTMLVN